MAKEKQKPYEFLSNLVLALMGMDRIFRGTFCLGKNSGVSLEFDTPYPFKYFHNNNENTVPAGADRLLSAKKCSRRYLGILAAHSGCPHDPD